MGIAIETSIEKLLKKNNFGENDIMYFVRSGRQSSIHLSDTRVVLTYIPIKSFMDFFDSPNFITINKGIAVNVGYVSNINNGVYTMCDDVQFKGRTRAAGQHKKNIEKINKTINSVKKFSERIPEIFSVMDKSPIAFAVIELIFIEDGHGIDFVFRYCNSAMLSLESRLSEEVLNKSFYEVFKDSNRKWLVSYADVALNGNKKILAYYLQKSNRKVMAYCYQPFERFCACSLIDVEAFLHDSESIQ